MNNSVKIQEDYSDETRAKKCLDTETKEEGKNAGRMQHCDVHTPLVNSQQPDVTADDQKATLLQMVQSQSQNDSVLQTKQISAFEDSSTFHTSINTMMDKKSETKVGKFAATDNNRKAKKRPSRSKAAVAERKRLKALDMEKKKLIGIDLDRKQEKSLDHWQFVPLVSKDRYRNTHNKRKKATFRNRVHESEKHILLDRIQWEFHSTSFEPIGGVLPPLFDPMLLPHVDIEHLQAISASVGTTESEKNVDG